MNNVKKVFIFIGIMLVVAATSFFGGYSLGRNKFDDSRIGDDTELIREQGDTIKIIESGVEFSIAEVEVIKDEIQESTKSVEIIDSGLKEITPGLQTDIEGIQGVIKRLKHYREKSELLEKSNAD